MKRFIYVINTLMFMSSLLIVTTFEVTEKRIDVDRSITYVNSDAIKKEVVVEEVEVVLEEDDDNTFQEEKNIIKDDIITNDKIEIKDEKVDIKDNNNEIINDLVSIKVGSKIKGSFSCYGADIGTNTASGFNISNTIYYEDKTYGNIRILSGDKKLPYGSIIKITNSRLGSFYGIVLDRGPLIGFDDDKKHTFDLLVKTSKEAKKFGVSYNTDFEIVRVGY